LLPFAVLILDFRFSEIGRAETDLQGASVALRWNHKSKRFDFSLLAQLLFDLSHHPCPSNIPPNAAVLLSGRLIVAPCELYGVFIFAPDVIS
jgi:hypothetical protein